VNITSKFVMQRKTWVAHDVQKYGQVYIGIALLFGLLYKPSFDGAEIEP
jgi:hypothetical protein